MAYSKKGDRAIVKPLTLLGNPIRVLALTLDIQGKKNTVADMVKTIYVRRSCS